MWSCLLVLKVWNLMRNPSPLYSIRDRSAASCRDSLCWEPLSWSLYSHVWNLIYLYGVCVEGMHQSVFYYQWSIHVDRMELPCHVNHGLKFRPYISYIAFKYAKYLWFGYLNFPSSNGSDWKYRGPKFQLPVVFPKLPFNLLGYTESLNTSVHIDIGVYQCHILWYCLAI